MSRLRYRLVKDSPELKKGAVVVESCDDGDQEFVLENKSKKFRIFSDEDLPTYTRMTVMKNPLWFEPIYNFCGVEITPAQKQRVMKLLKIKEPTKKTKK